MNELPKGWYASKTVWAGIIAGIFPVLNLLSLQFHFVLPDQQIFVDFLTSIGTVAGALVAIYGRITAKTPIGKPADSTPSA